MFLLLLLAAPAAWARVNTEKPLAADEGWLLVVADNQSQANALLLEGPGALNDDLANLDKGRNVRLLRAKAGSYRWSRVGRGNQYWNLGRDPATEFTVQAGVINYPGNFILNSADLGTGTFFFSNRSLLAMMALDKSFPGVRERHAWRSAFAAPDPFVEFAVHTFTPDKTEALRASYEAAAEKIRAGNTDEDFSKRFNQIYAGPRVAWPSLSPDGKLVAFKERRAGGVAVMLIEVDSGERVELLQAEGDVQQLAWASDRALYVFTSLDQGLIDIDLHAGGWRPARDSLQQGLHLFRLGKDPLTVKNFSSVHLPGAVMVLNPVSSSDSLGLLVRRDSGGEVHAFAFDETRGQYDVRDFRADQWLDKGLKNALSLFADSRGELRAALVGGDGGSIALAVRGSEGKWQQRAPLPANIVLRPVGLSPDGSHLIVLSDHARAQVEMVKLDLASGALTETLMAEPGADLVRAVSRSRDDAVIGAQFYRNGGLHTRYLPRAGDARLDAAARKFPGGSVTPIDDSRDDSRLLLLVTSETSPGTFYFFDRANGKVEKVVDQRDAFTYVEPVVSTAFTVKNADGLPLQGFLALPAGAKGKLPLLVMPQADPTGARGSQEFDTAVQMLVGNGFAVLRIDHRGFDDSGKWRRGVETDLDLVLDHALDKFPLDRQRIALWGTGYDGYFTLMSLISRPEKYRCGVVIAAVTDLPLMFSSSDWARSDKAVASMKRVVGDPQQQLEQLRQSSPVYQYQRLKQPLLLIHGGNDLRVAYEHTWRLYGLLVSEGRAPSLLTLPRADHSLARYKDQLAVHTASSNFLRSCLQAAAPAAAARP